MSSVPIAADCRSGRLVDAVGVHLQRQRHAERRHLAIEEAIAKIRRDALPRQLTAIVKARHVADVERRERRPELDTKVRRRNEFDLHFLIERAIAAAILDEASGGLALGVHARRHRRHRSRS